MKRTLCRCTLCSKIALCYCTVFIKFGSSPVTQEALICDACSMKTNSDCIVLPALDDPKALTNTSQASLSL